MVCMMRIPHHKTLICKLFMWIWKLSDSLSHKNVGSTYQLQLHSMPLPVGDGKWMRRVMGLLHNSQGLTTTWSFEYKREALSLETGGR